MNSSTPFSYATAVKSGSGSTSGSGSESESESGSGNERVVWTLTLAEVMAVILYRIQKFPKDNEQDFQIVWDEEDGCDEYGSMFWVYCRGGWSGRSWDLDTARHHNMLKQKQDMFLNGIKIGSKVYYLDPVMYRQNWYDPSSIEVKLISEEQHAAYITNGEALSNIHDKIVANCGEIDKKKRSQIYKAFRMTTKIQYMLKQVKVSGIADFKEALLVAEIEEYGTIKDRCMEHNLIIESLSMLDATDRSLIGLTD
jgi:hypothetical protein